MSSVISARVTSLVDQVVTTMLVDRLKFATLVLLLVAVLGLGAGGWFYHALDIARDNPTPEREQAITAEDLPAAVRRTLDRTFPGAIWTEIFQVSVAPGKDKTFAHYDVLLITADKDKVEVELSSDGKILDLEKAETDRQKGP
jgi:hypothetical protein